MLTAKHLTGLCLDRFRMEKMWELPTPQYVRTPISQQMYKLGEIILTQLLKLDPERFKKQLDEARNQQTSYLVKRNGRSIGLSVAASLIKGNPLNKHLILPAEYLEEQRNTLSNHFIIAAFVRGNVEVGQLCEIGDITIAGFTHREHLRNSWDSGLPAFGLPGSFKSSLPALASFPCRDLSPMEELIPEMEEHLHAQNA